MAASSDAAADESADYGADYSAPYLGDKPFPDSEFVTRRELEERLAKFLDDEIHELSTFIGWKKKRRKELHRKFGTRPPTE